MNGSVTVVTVTRGRPNLLRRAIESVRAQDYTGTIQHVVVVDDDPATSAAVMSERETADRRVVLHVEATPAEAERRPGDRRFVYPRLARLLNVGIDLATAQWIAFLDDDNEYEPDHLSSLIAFALETRGVAVHSTRQMVWPDGSPYLEPFFPGAPNREEGARLYELMCQRGVWLRGTNILSDRVDVGTESRFRNSTIMTIDDPVFLVDQNLWLIRRDVLRTIRVPEDFSDEELAANTCPDDKLLAALVSAGVRIECSGRPTVRGFSR